MSDTDTNCHFNDRAGGENSGGLYIETPRLILREVRPEDAQRIYEITSTPGFDYYCFDGSREKADEFTHKCIITQVPDPATGMREKYMMAVTLKDTGTFIGIASLEQPDYPIPLQGIHYESNYFTDPAYQGKAYGVEALVNVIHYGFNKLALPYLVSAQEPENVKAIGIAEQIYGYKKVDEVMIPTVQGQKLHQFCTLQPTDFYALRKLDKRPYMLPPPGGDSHSPQPSP